MPTQCCTPLTPREWPHALHCLEGNGGRGVLIDRVSGAGFLDILAKCKRPLSGTGASLMAILPLLLQSCCEHRKESCYSRLLCFLLGFRLRWPVLPSLSRLGGTSLNTTSSPTCFLLREGRGKEVSGIGVGKFDVKREERTEEGNYQGVWIV